jgi:hypothetical protein
MSKKLSAYLNWFHRIWYNSPSLKLNTGYGKYVYSALTTNTNSRKNVKQFGCFQTYLSTMKSISAQIEAPPISAGLINFKHLNTNWLRKYVVSVWRSRAISYSCIVFFCVTWCEKSQNIQNELILLLLFFHILWRMWKVIGCLESSLSSSWELNIWNVLTGYLSEFSIHIPSFKKWSSSEEGCLNRVYCWSKGDIICFCSYLLSKWLSLIL